MAIKVRIPYSASQTTVSGCIPQSLNADVWLGFVTSITASGSCTFFRSSSEVAGSIMCSIVASPGRFEFIPYVFNSPNGIFAGCISGGSAFWWINPSGLA